MKTKKGAFMGMMYGILLLIAVLGVLGIIGAYQIAQEEIMMPFNSMIVNTINESTNIEDKSKWVNLVNEAQDDILNITIPFNLMLFFIVIVLLGVMGISAARQTKGSITEVLFFSTSGVIFLIFVASLGLINIVNFIAEDIIFYLFGDILVTHLPLGLWILENWIEVLLFCALFNILVNRLLGRDDNIPTF